MGQPALRLPLGATLNKLLAWWRALGNQMILRAIFLFILCLLPNTATANKELVLRSTSATYELVGGYRLSLQANSDGEKLKSVTLTYKNGAVTIPAKELTQVNKPVLSAVLVSGGALGSQNIDEPQAITIGFGANHCELNDCPLSVIFIIKDLKYVESYLVKNGQ